MLKVLKLPSYSFDAWIYFLQDQVSYHQKFHLSKIDEVFSHCRKNKKCYFQLCQILNIVALSYYSTLHPPPPPIHSHPHLHPTL
jgi:hypothetical protein